MTFETVDKLFLELSQVTTATTGKELALQQQTAALTAENEKLRVQLSGQTCFVPPEFHEEMDAVKAELAEQCRLLGMSESWEAALLARIASLEAKVSLAASDYEDAIEDIASWADYASDYSQKKHDLSGCLENHRAALAKLREPT